MFWSAVLVCAVAYFLWRWFEAGEPHPLDGLPGPPMLPVIGNGLTFIGFKPDEMFVKLRQLRNEHGDRFLIKIFNRRIIHLNHPDDIEVVLSHSRNIKKNKPYRFLEPWLGQGLLLSYGAKWYRRRKILTPTFHFNILKHFSGIIERQTRNLTATLRNDQGCVGNEGPMEGACGQRKGKVVELLPLISTFTIQTLCETAMGTKLDEDASSATVEYKNSVLTMGGALLGRLSRVWLHPDFIFNLSHRGKLFRKNVEIVHAFPDNVIKQRKNNFTPYEENEDEADEVYGKKRKLAMMDLLLAAEQKGEIDLEGIREEVNTFMFEGHDTTSMALTFALMLLAEHPGIQEKIYEECMTICGKDRPVCSDDLAEMKYLEAVIKETLRLYPSVPFIAREITEDFTIGDLRVPAGSEAAIHIYDLHRRPDYHEDPLTFKPERFLLGAPASHAYCYVPFSAGPRNCIGRRFAMQEMKYVLSEICREFTLGPVEGSRPHQVTLVSDLVLRCATPIHVVFTPRH